MKIKKKAINKKIILGAVCILAAAGVFLAFKSTKAAKTAAGSMEAMNTATVEKRNITSELSSTGTVSPKNTYDITSLVEGEVMSADFEEGDQVEKDQILYQIDISSMESELRSAENSLERNQSSYQRAVEDYNEAVSDFSGNTYKSTENGYIKTLYITAGDKVGANTKIADIYNDQIMKLRIPFLSSDAAQIAVGSEAVVTLTDTQEQITGTVTAVSNMEETLSGGRVVRYLIIQVTNPGGLTSSMAAVAAVGEFDCSMEGTFEPQIDTVMNADLSSNVDVEALLVSEGDYISKGTGIFKIETKSVEKLLRTYKDAMDKAADTLESSQSKLESTQDTYGNYTITAPISGQVITKTVKQGDKISKNSGGTTTLAVIYDLSVATFEMSVDELDVRKVQVGQTVQVTADAVEGETFTGTVTNVSLQSTYANGVTNYPVTVTLDRVGDLLPGMNVDAKIILSQADDVLTIPADALMRGNKVYVKDDTIKEATGAVPAGFRSVDVETGLISEDYVEIVSGLSEGDIVYVDQSTVKNESMMNMQMAVPMGGGEGGPPSGGGQGGGSRGSGGQGGGMR